MKRSFAPSAVARARPSAPRAGAWLLFLGPFFFATYGLATWVTAQRAQRRRRSSSRGNTRSRSCRGRSCRTGRSTLLYAISLFVCADRRELDTHAKRLLTAQVVAIASFLLFPLRVHVRASRSTDGVFGDLFALLARSTSRSTRRRRCTSRCSSSSGRSSRASSRGAARVLLDASFAADRRLGADHVAASLHRRADRARCSASSACGCGRRAQPTPLAAARWTRDRRRLVLAARYAAGALLAAAIGVRRGRRRVVAACGSSVALALVALNYAWLGRRDSRSTTDDCRRPRRVLLAPYLAGAVVNAKAWTRGRARRSITSPTTCGSDDCRRRPISSAAGSRRSSI